MKLSFFWGGGVGEHTKVDSKKLMLGPDDSKANIFLKKKRFLGKVMNANFLYSKYDFDMTVPLLALLSKITTLSISWLSATV